MDDAELDRALKAALSVSPSPEFVAKVRTAIREEPAGWTFTRWLVPAGALALLTTLAIVLTGLDSQRAVPADMPGERAGADIVLRAAPAGAVATEVTSNVVPRRLTESPIVRNAVRRPAVPAQPDFEVVFSPADAAAYRRIFESVGAMPYRLSSDPTVEPEHKAMTAIDIAPIVIAPLDDLSDSTGVFQ
jgi:hypothetical protein